MKSFSIYKQQHIPLSSIETDYIKHEIKRFKKQTVVLWLVLLLAAACVFFFTGFKNTGLNVAVAGIVLVSGAVTVLIAGQQIKRLQKDHKQGKTILHTVIAGKSSNDEPLQDSLIFYADESGRPLILKVTRQQFLQYKPGHTVEVSYLPNYREVLQIDLVK